MSDITDIRRLADELSDALVSYTQRKSGGHRGDVEMIRQTIAELENLTETLRAAWDQELRRTEGRTI